MKCRMYAFRLAHRTSELEPTVLPPIPPFFDTTEDDQRAIFRDRS